MCLVCFWKKEKFSEKNKKNASFFKIKSFYLSDK